MARKTVIDRRDIGTLLEALKKSEYEVIGPVRNDNAITYDRVDAIEELPIGWIDRQDNGHYRLIKNGRPALFDYVVGQQSWKKFLHLPVRELLQISRNNKNLEIKENREKPSRRAFLGVRSCELKALSIHDEILQKGQFVDSGYRALREGNFIVAVSCTRPGGTCFCNSMKTGPAVTGGYDLALTEIIENEGHYFLAEIGSEAGQDILNMVPHHDATEAELSSVEKELKQAADSMGRKLKTGDLKELLERNFDNPRWDEVAKRCLTCGNCTLVCPTCFCSNIEDETSLSGDSAIRRRMWDSCFTVGFSYIHGGSIRSTEMSRYRQWLMHKLCYWVDQFGGFGCVGCGRCITWCPVGIDITEEVRLIRKSEKT